jgi:hypothetical protein
MSDSSSTNKPSTDASGNKPSTATAATATATAATATAAAAAATKSTTTDASGNKLTANSNINTNTTFDLNKTLEEAFNKSNIVFLLWFLAIYFILYFLISLFTKPSNSQTAASGASSAVGSIADIIVFLLLIIYIGALTFSSSPEQNQKNIEQFGTTFKTYLQDPYSLLSLFLFMLVFYLVIYILGISMGEKSKPISIWLIENIAILLFVILVICDFFKYVLGIDLVKPISDKIADWWKNTDSGKTTKTDLSGNVAVHAAATTTTATATSSSTCTNKPQKIPGAEVFNIANNLYTYDDAQAICKAYGARLATYDDIEQAYNDGGEWCNYGWSDNQMAFFPTQKATWENLQKTKNHKNDCGRPGINGGYFDNPNIRFGVNCYGKKPKPSQSELSMMEYNKNQQYAKTPEERAIDEKVKYWQENASSLLNVNSFNTNKWSERNG